MGRKRKKDGYTKVLSIGISDSDKEKWERYKTISCFKSLSSFVRTAVYHYIDFLERNKNAI